MHLYIQTRSVAPNTRTQQIFLFAQFSSSRREYGSSILAALHSPPFRHSLVNPPRVTALSASSSFVPFSALWVAAVNVENQAPPYRAFIAFISCHSPYMVDVLLGY
nr:hypothetical protein Iba_chr01dCG12650 [Ipomoea batatas]GMC54801.1 hypothetical protein Iba_chr01eCG1350 [Ipomoea batatas]